MYKLSIFSFFLGIITFWGCKEPDITPDNNKEFPIAIEVKENPSGGLEISWPKVNINKFENYTLIRSADSLGFSGFNSDTLWTIDDIEQTKIIDKNLPLLGKIYYRFSVNVKDRELQAKAVAYQRKDIFVFDNVFYNSLFYNPSKNLIYLFNNQNVQTINVQTGVLSKVITIPSLNGKKFQLNQEDPDNLYFVGEDKIVIYDAATLTLRQTLVNTNYPMDRFVGVTSGYGKYYVTMYGNLTKVKVFDAASKALIKTYNTNISLNSYMGIRILPGQKRLLTLSNSGQDDEAILFDLDDTGNILSHNKVQDNLFLFYEGNCLISPNGENIIFNNRYIFNKNLEQIGTVPTLNSGSVFPSYSPDGLHLLTDDNFSSSQIIDMKSFQVIKNIPFKNNSSLNSNFTLFLTNTEYVSFGETFIPSGGRRVIISKTKFL